MRPLPKLKHKVMRWSAHGPFQETMAPARGCCKSIVLYQQDLASEDSSTDHIRLHRYYVLIVACVVARKTEWLRKACLAAALLFPAIAALHAIVLAAVHTNGKQLPRSQAEYN